MRRNDSASRGGFATRASVGVMSEPAKIDGLAMSGFALHAERLLKQYANLTPKVDPADRYEATLTLSVLQFLLTNCWELYKHLNDKKAARELASLRDYISAMLLEDDVEVTKDLPKPSSRDPKAIIEHLRNALSHPVPSIVDYPVTGYTTKEDGSSIINRIVFTDSPNVTSKGKLKDVEQEDDIEVFEIEIPLRRLEGLAYRIASALAQPARERWNEEQLLLIPTDD
jgi:hypothetical protein